MNSIKLKYFGKIIYSWNFLDNLSIFTGALKGAEMRRKHFIGCYKKYAALDQKHSLRPTDMCTGE